jgi:hypothetical protein
MAVRNVCLGVHAFLQNTANNERPKMGNVGNAGIRTIAFHRGYVFEKSRFPPDLSGKSG